MHSRHLNTVAVLLLALLILSSCRSTPVVTPSPSQPALSVNGQPVAGSTPASTPTASPQPPRVLTVCMGREPSSLFLYGDSSLAARTVRSAIYDGPYDMVQFEPQPVILESIPSLSNGGAVLEPVEVKSGDWVVDANGELATFKKDVAYLPAGCNEASCAATYSGTDPVTMDQLAVRFQLLPDIIWSDGVTLTANDSVYSFELASQLRSSLVGRTASYLALDEQTVEWRGVPGYRDPSYATRFFTPLPQHAWGSLPAQELQTAEVSASRPLGWGPYSIEEWTVGDHITLVRNASYFRAGQGSPYFDRLVFRFGYGVEATIAALVAGECDVIDDTAGLELAGDSLKRLQDSGQVDILTAPGLAWEHADFGLASLDPDLPNVFQLKETRQAVAHCIDRQKMADTLFFAPSIVPDSYASTTNPLRNPQIKTYPFDPEAGSQALQALGWLDPDNNPATPRISQGVPGLADGTTFEFSFLTTTETEKQQAAEILKDSMAQCGIQVTIQALPWDELVASGPEGPVFGRKFSLAQFGWLSTPEPPCALYTSDEVPGAYPVFPRGWGGANASGYSNTEYDSSCRAALNSLPDDPLHASAHAQAQAIFADDLPSIPLYARLKVLATTKGLCGPTLEVSADNPLWNLETWQTGEGCPDR